MLEKMELKVSGMSCGHCVKTIETAIQELDARAIVQTDIRTHKIVVQTVKPRYLIEKAILESGYTLEK